MSNLPTYKRFPGPSGGDTTPRVTVSRPIPLREVPLKGLKSMVFPKANARDMLPTLFHDNPSNGDSDSFGARFLVHLRNILLWGAVVLLTVVLYLYAALLLMSLFWR